MDLSAQTDSQLQQFAGGGGGTPAAGDLGGRVEGFYGLRLPVASDKARWWARSSGSVTSSARRRCISRRRPAEHRYRLRAPGPGG